MAQLYVGIDLGTTNSTVSVIQTEDRRLRNPIDHLRSIPILQYDKDFNLTRDKYTLPSYFYCKNDGKTKRVYTGEWAKNIYATGNQPMNTFTGIKTRMGGESMITIPGKSEDDELQLEGYGTSIKYSTFAESENDSAVSSSFIRHCAGTSFGARASWNTETNCRTGASSSV